MSRIFYKTIINHITMKLCLYDFCIRKNYLFVEIQPSEGLNVNFNKYVKEGNF